MCGNDDGDTFRCNGMGCAYLRVVLCAIFEIARKDLCNSLYVCICGYEKMCMCMYTTTNVY